MKAKTIFVKPSILTRVCQCPCGRVLLLLYFSYQVTLSKLLALSMNKNECIYPICKATIIEKSSDKDRLDSVFCEGQCMPSVDS